MDRAIRSEGKVVLRKTGPWKWRMRSRAERTWTSRGTDYRGSCERSKDTLVCRRKFKAASKNICNSSCGEVEHWRNDLLLSTRGRRRGLKRHRVSSIKEEHAKGNCCCSGGDAEDQRRHHSKKRSACFFCKTKSPKMKWQKRKWKRNFMVCRQLRRIAGS